MPISGVLTTRYTLDDTKVIPFSHWQTRGSTTKFPQVPEGPFLLLAQTARIDIRIMVSALPLLSSGQIDDPSRVWAPNTKPDSDAG